MLAVTGDEGSNGKTTTTLGLASVLNGPVLAIDANRDIPDLHTMAGAGRPMDATSGIPVREPSIQSHPTNSTASMLPAPAGTDDGAFERWLRVAAGNERRAVVDCPAEAGPGAAIPLRVADGVVVVSPLCAPAPRDAAKTAAMARTLDTPVVGYVIFRSRVAPKAASDLVGAPVFGTVPKESSPVLTRPTVRATHRRIADKVPGKK